jgi:hypothetical protein
MQRQIEDSTITVPVPNYKEIRVGTLQSIIRQSGLPRNLFEVMWGMNLGAGVRDFLLQEQDDEGDGGG